MTKPQTPPRILNERGRRETEVFKSAYDSDKTSYDSGQKKFEFNRDIYSAKSVKNKLIKAQHKKCCFCESIITHVDYGDVEHLRPKAGYRQVPEDDLTRPGYYWLAYDWENLFLSCALCNQRYKKNLFPLADPSSRAHSHHDSIEHEQPLFVSPAESPEELISFNQEIPFAVNGDERGETTIKALGLDRDDLNEERRKWYVQIKCMYIIIKYDPSDIPEADKNEARDFLERAQTDKYQYSAMIRAAIRNGFSLHSDLPD